MNSVYENIIYDLSQYLTQDQIDAERQKNMEYDRLFYNDKFKQLVRQKFSQSNQGVANPTQKLIDDILNNNKGFTYTVNNKGEGHTITYLKGNYGGEEISRFMESVRSYGPEHENYSILLDLYGNEAKGKNSKGQIMFSPNYSLEKPDRAEVRQILRAITSLPDFDVDKLRVYK